MGRRKALMCGAWGVLLVLLSSLCASTRAAGVVNIAADDWQKVVGDKNKHVVVWFFSPWSGHCKRFAPTYAALAKAHESKDEFVFAKIDAYENMGLAREHGIKAFPTIKYFPKELKEDGAASRLNTELAVNGGELYHGALTVKDISSFIATSNFLERFKPPPPPPPATQSISSWMGFSEEDSFSVGSNGQMYETSVETMSFGPGGMITETSVETFSWRL